MPTPRDHLVVGVVDGKIHAIGGRLRHSCGANLDAHEIYDPWEDTWSRAATLPTTRSGIAAVAVGGRVYVSGGEAPAGTFDENEAYDPATDSWERLAPMPTARHGLGAALVGDTIYVIGGGTPPGSSDGTANEAFKP